MAPTHSQWWNLLYKITQPFICQNSNLFGLLLTIYEDHNSPTKSEKDNSPACFQVTGVTQPCDDLTKLGFKSVALSIYK